MLDPATCPHKNFTTNAGVSLVVDSKKKQTTGFQLTAKVRCDDCGQPFHFPGLPICGKVALVPSAIDDGTTLVVPMQVGDAKVSLN